MGNGREGKSHSPKGKPSGANEEEGLGLTPILNPEALESEEQITERYTTGPDGLAPGVPVRHRNRKTNKGDDRSRSEEILNKSRQANNAEEVSTASPEELVPIIPRDLFNYLASYQSGICVSILLPTHPAGVEVNEQVDLIEFKNSLQQAEKIFVQKNIDQNAVKKILQPAYDLLGDGSLWHNLSPGLAVYMAEDFIKFIRLPGTVSKEILVNSSFAVSQLIPFMVRMEYFYILVINKKNPKFYRADAFGIEYIPIDDLPVAVDDVVHFENKEDETLFRLSNNGSRVASYHGMGGGKPDEKQNIAIYLEEVDDTLWKTHLHYSNAPLLLAGVEFLVPIYRSVSGYKHIWPVALTGNHQNVDSNTLYKQAMAVMAPYFEENLQKALEDYGNKSATPLTSSIIADVIPAAYYGRISHLFVRRDAQIWGTFREDSSELNLMDAEVGDAENLADRAAAKTIQGGGQVFLLPKEKMPQPSDLAAIFRY